MSAIYLVYYFIVKWCFISGNLALNVGYFFHRLLICIIELKCCEKQDEMTYKIGYLYFIGE